MPAAGLARGVDSEVVAVFTLRARVRVDDVVDAVRIAFHFAEAAGADVHREEVAPRARPRGAADVRGQNGVTRAAAEHAAVDRTRAVRSDRRVADRVKRVSHVVVFELRFIDTSER